MMFWTDGLENSTRLRNIKHTSKKLRELTDFLNTQNIVCNSKIYDYSPEQLIEESIHIPYPVGVYKRSEKINNILNNTTSDLFAIIDCDCFIANEDYEALANTINSTSLQSCITFDVIDFSESQTESVVNTGCVDGSFVMGSRFPGRAGMLGALFITNTENLKAHGGFDLKFTTWGGEDGEIYDKIWRDNSITKLPVRRDKIKLYHLSHVSDRSNINYFNHDEYVRNNY